MYGGVENGDAGSGYGLMNSHTDLQYIGLESSMKNNDRNNTDMNYTLQNGDVSIGIGFLNSHNIHQDN